MSIKNKLIFFNFVSLILNFAFIHFIFLILGFMRTKSEIYIRVDTHMMFILRGVGDYGKNEMLPDVGGWGVNECSGRPIFIFLLKKIEFAQ